MEGSGWHWISVFLCVKVKARCDDDARGLRSTACDGCTQIAFFGYRASCQSTRTQKRGGSCNILILDMSHPRLACPRKSKVTGSGWRHCNKVAWCQACMI